MIISPASSGLYKVSFVKPVLIKNVSSSAIKLLSQNPNLIFSVQTHPLTKYQIYIKVLDQLKIAKASKISIANPPSY